MSTPPVSRGRAAPQGSSTLPNQAIPTQSGPSAQLPASAGSQASLPARQLSQLEVDPATLTVVRSRHPWRWVAAIAMLILVAQFINGLVTNPGWDWPAFAQYFTAPAVLHALWLTIQLTVYGTVLGFALGMALAAARLSKNPVLQTVSWTYVWAFRSIPLIVQLLFWFNIAYLYQNLSIGIPFGPSFFSFDVNATISGMAAAVIGLGLHQAAYSAEIIRAGILSVDQGQLEAAAALGIPKRRQFFKIVLPQAMRGILPNAANEVISLFKGTSIVSTMAIAELFYQVQVIYGRNGRVVPLLMVATVWYILLTTVLSIVQYYVERHYAKGAVRTLPLTPWQKVQRKITNINAGRQEAILRGRPMSTIEISEAPRAVDRAYAVEVHGVHKSFGALEVLRGIDLTVRRGEVTAILGPSGSGKSTLLRTLNHLEKVDSGLILVDGDPVGYRLKGTKLHELKEREILHQRSKVGFVFQNFNLFPHLTVLENVVEAPISAQRRNRREVDAEARTLLAESASATSCTPIPGNSPAASSSGWRSPGHSPCARRSSSSTNRPRHLIPSWSAKCSTSSSNSPKRAGH